MLLRNSKCALQFLNLWSINKPKVGKKIILEVLISWANLPIEDATWEDPLHLHQEFLEFDVEDKVNFEGGRNDRNAANPA